MKLKWTRDKASEMDIIEREKGRERDRGGESQTDCPLLAHVQPESPSASLPACISAPLPLLPYLLCQVPRYFVAPWLLLLIFFRSFFHFAFFFCIARIIGEFVQRNAHRNCSSSSGGNNGGQSALISSTLFGQHKERGRRQTKHGRAECSIVGRDWRADTLEWVQSKR